jgi:hypothetical protein
MKKVDMNKARSLYFLSRQDCEGNVVPLADRTTQRREIKTWAIETREGTACTPMVECVSE